METKVIEVEQANYMNYPISTTLQRDLNIYKLVINTFFSLPAFRNEDINLFVTGSSGAILAAIFVMEAQDRKVDVFYIKKNSEESYTDYNDRLEYIKGDRVNIFLDDHVCYGKTIRRVYEKLKDRCQYNFKMDVIIVTGEIREQYLPFKPELLICGRLLKEKRLINPSCSPGIFQQQMGRGERKMLQREKPVNVSRILENASFSESISVTGIIDDISSRVTEIKNGNTFLCIKRYEHRNKEFPGDAIFSFGRYYYCKIDGVLSDANDICVEFKDIELFNNHFRISKVQ